MPIDFENITDHTGVRIYNFDASKNVDEDDLNEIKELMQNKHFICFKNQKLDEDSLINFCKNFGNLESYPEKNKTKKNIQIFNVANISADGEHLNENDPRVVLQLSLIHI